MTDSALVSVSPVEIVADGVVRPMIDLEREIIQKALAMNGGNIARTARQLGVGRKKLSRRMKRYSDVTKEKGA